MATALDLEEVVSKLASENAELKAALGKLEHENKRLSDELAILLNRFFRRKSERLDPNQMRLFLEELQGAAAEAPGAEQEEREDAPSKGSSKRATAAPRLRCTCRARRSSSTCPRPNASAPTAAKH